MIKTKICTKCKRKLHIKNFNFKVKPNVFYAMCKKCKSDYGKAHYNKNKDAYKRKAKAFTKKARIRNKNFIIEYKKAHPCKKCGFTDYRALQFHHARGDKFKSLSDMAHRIYSIKNIENEIKKCVVLCANCHMILHSKQRE